MFCDSSCGIGIGVVVELHDLSKSEFNGRFGVCQSWDPTKERWNVSLLKIEGNARGLPSFAMRSQETKSFKGTNLAVVAIETICPQGHAIQVAQELNADNKCGACCEYLDAQDPSIRTCTRPECDFNLCTKCHSQIFIHRPLQTVHVHVIALSGTPLLRLDFKMDESIKVLKDHLAKASGVPARYQSLLHEAEILDRDYMTLSEISGATSGVVALTFLMPSITRIVSDCSVGSDLHVRAQALRAVALLGNKAREDTITELSENLKQSVIEEGDYTNSFFACEIIEILEGLLTEASKDQIVATWCSCLASTNSDVRRAVLNALKQHAKGDQTVAMCLIHEMFAHSRSDVREFAVVAFGHLFEQYDETITKHLDQLILDKPYHSAFLRAATSARAMLNKLES